MEAYYMTGAGQAVNRAAAALLANTWHLLLVAAVVVLVVAVWDALALPTRWRYRHIPGPAFRPLVGNLPDFIKYGSHEYWRQCAQKYGPVFKVWWGATPWVIVADADIGRKVNNKFVNRPSTISSPLVRGQERAFDSMGLFLSRSERWRTLRVAWQPTFTSSSLHGYVPVMDECAGHLVERLQALASEEPGGEVDIWRQLGDLTLNVVGGTAYGVDFHTLDVQPSEAAADGRRLVEACKDAFATISMATRSPYVRAALLLPSFRPLVQLLVRLAPDAYYDKMMRSRLAIRAMSRKLLAKWQASNSGREGPVRVAGGVRPGSFMGLLLEARDKAQAAAAKKAVAKGQQEDGKAADDAQAAPQEWLSDMGIVAQANTFTLAGYETTANTLAYAIYNISLHPEVQDKVLQEVDAFGPQRDLSPSDLDSFPYINAVVDETLRLYPPGASTVREAREDTDLGGLMVPAGSVINVATYTLHHDPKYWPSPKEFLPERWLKGHEQLAVRNENAYLPFGAGARLCIGWRFALQETRMVLVKLYQHFTFELTPGQVPLEVSTGITMGPKNGIKVRLVPREVAGQVGGQDRGSRGRAAGKADRALQEDSAPAGEMAAEA